MNKANSFSCGLHRLTLTQAIICSFTFDNITDKKNGKLRASHVAQLVQCSPSMYKALGATPKHCIHQHDDRASYHSTREAEAGGSGDQGLLPFRVKFENSLDLG